MHHSLLYAQVAPGVQPKLGSSVAHSDIELPPMPLPPFYLELAHFYSRLPPSILVTTIESKLRGTGANPVDVSFDRDKCKWKIDLYVNNHQLKICGRLYSVMGEVSVVEFNRRKGESFVFCTWYRELHSSLVVQNAICNKDGGMIAVPKNKKRRNLIAPACPVINVDCLAPLLEMANTSFIEMQAEAAREVANLSSRCENRCSIVTAGFLEPLVKLLQSHDGDVHRCAAVAVGNIAEGAETNADVRAGLNVQSPKMLDNLCGLLKKKAGVDCDVQAHRVAARALGNLVQHCGVTLAPQHKKCLSQFHERCSDHRLQADCSRVLQLVA